MLALLAAAVIAALAILVWQVRAGAIDGRRSRPGGPRAGSAGRGGGEGSQPPFDRPVIPRTRDAAVDDGRPRNVVTPSVPAKPPGTTRPGEPGTIHYPPDSARPPGAPR
jgi:hypothetical protein